MFVFLLFLKDASPPRIRNSSDRLFLVHCRCRRDDMNGVGEGAGDDDDFEEGGLTAEEIAEALGTQKHSKR